MGGERTGGQPLGRRRVRVARVRGVSMEPTLRDGDLVVVWSGAPMGLDDLVVAQVPGRPLLVKRVVAREPDGWWLERDNPRAGLDSWTVGVVPDEDMVGRVAFRLWPPRRRTRPPPTRPLA